MSEIKIIEVPKWGLSMEEGTLNNWLIEEGVIFVNGVAATERRKKLYPGDKVEIPENGRWQVVAAEA